MEKLYRVRSIDAYHSYYVDEAIKRFQDKGFAIISVKQTSRCWLCFGEDITEIWYETEPNKTTIDYSSW